MPVSRRHVSGISRQRCDLFSLSSCLGPWGSRRWRTAAPCPPPPLPRPLQRRRRCRHTTLALLTVLRRAATCSRQRQRDRVLVRRPLAAPPRRRRPTRVARPRRLRCCWCRRSGARWSRVIRTGTRRSSPGCVCAVTARTRADHAARPASASRRGG